MGPLSKLAALAKSSAYGDFFCYGVTHGLPEGFAVIIGAKSIYRKTSRRRGMQASGNNSEARAEKEKTNIEVAKGKFSHNSQDKL